MNDANDNRPPYPIPICAGNGVYIAAHFKNLKKDPPAHLMPRWRELVLRRMAGQNVDAEIRGLLGREREWNRTPANEATA